MRASLPCPSSSGRVAFPARRAIRFGFAESCQASERKIFCFTEYPNQRHNPPRLVLTEGRFAIVTIRRARDAMDAAASGMLACRTKTPAADGEVVWFWRRDPGVKLLVSPSWRRWQKRPLTGESTKETVKPLRGESRCDWLNL